MDMTEAADIARTEQKEAESETAQDAPDFTDLMVALVGEKFDAIKLDRRENEVAQLAATVLLELTGNLGNRAFHEYLLDEAADEDQRVPAQLAGMAFDQADAFYAIVDARKATKGPQPLPGLEE